MLVSTKLLAAAALLSSVICPITSSPVPAPMFEQQGRDYLSRFAPNARPFIKRDPWNNSTWVVARGENARENALAERATPSSEEPASPVIDERHLRWPTSTGHHHKKHKHNHHERAEEDEE